MTGAGAGAGRARVSRPGRARVRGAVLMALLVVGCSPTPIAGTPQVGPVAGTARPVLTAPSTERVVTRIVSLKTADGTRTAIVHHPADAVAGAPLLVVLHPAASTAAQMEVSFGWDAIAERNHLVVAYPEGLLDGYQDTWNGGGCCAPANELGTDDVGFLSALATALRATDQLGSRVFAVGYSNGGFLAYAWACSRPGLLSGLGVVAAALLTACTAPGPMTVVAVHGTADAAVPIRGGVSSSGLLVPTLAASLAPFRAAAHCPAQPVADSAGKATISRWNCAGGKRVVADVITGLDHSWPGAGSTAGLSASPLDATGFLWANLSRR